MIGVGLVFGLGLVLTLFTYKNIESFFTFATIIDAFCVYAGLLESWTLVILIVVVSILYIRYLKAGGSVIT